MRIKGQKGRLFNDRELASRVRTLALNEIEAILKQENMTQLKHELILRLASSILPRMNEITGKDGGPVELKGVEIQIRK